VPKTAVDKNDLTSAREYQIRVSGQVSRMQAIAKTHPVNKVPDCEFRFRVLRPNPAHPLAALCGGQCVHDRTFSFTLPLVANRIPVECAPTAAVAIAVGFRRILFPSQFYSGLRFAQSDCRKEQYLVFNPVQQGNDSAVGLALPAFRDNIGIEQVVA
jgi:hypothetical protein